MPLEFCSRVRRQSGERTMWDWFKANWLGVVQTVGVIGSACGLWLTYSQLKSANAQLEQAKQALRANTIFAIQKDGRELIGTLSADTKLFRFIFDMDKGIAADQELRLKATVR